MSMRVERSTLDQVKKRFEVNKKKMEEKQKDYDFEERMKELREEVRHTCTAAASSLAIPRVTCADYQGQHLLPLFAIHGSEGNDSKPTLFPGDSLGCTFILSFFFGETGDCTFMGSCAFIKKKTFSYSLHRVWFTKN